MISRRVYLMALANLAFLSKLFGAASTITVYKDATCGCCDGWVEHLRKNDFKVIVKEVATSELRAVKTRYGIPPDLQTCHTAIGDDYVIEGHVPAADLQRFLKERPKATGIVVPGMPIGSPGMEGKQPEAYSVLLFHSTGQTSVYRKYAAQ